MASDGIPEEVRQFIFEHIDSIEQLEVLLLLYRTQDRDWCAREVSEELRTNPESAAMRLSGLLRAGVVRVKAGPPERFGFAPPDSARAALLDALAEAYKVRKYRVYELIFSPMKRAREFAGAFVVRRPVKPEGSDG